MKNDSGRREDVEFITVAELRDRIKFSKQTIYNMISTGRFLKGKHYFKPSPKKVLFSWPAVETWIKRNESEVVRAEKAEVNKIKI